MNPATIQLTIQALTLLLTYAPAIAKDVAQLVDLLRSGKDPTPEQLAQIDANLQQSHADLQAAQPAQA